VYCATVRASPGHGDLKVEVVVVEVVKVVVVVVVVGGSGGSGDGVGGGGGGGGGVKWWIAARITIWYLSATAYLLSLIYPTFAKCQITNMIPRYVLLLLDSKFWCGSVMRTTTSLFNCRQRLHCISKCACDDKTHRSSEQWIQFF